MNEVPAASEWIGIAITTVFLVFAVKITYEAYQKFKNPYDNE